MSEQVLYRKYRPVARPQLGGLGRALQKPSVSDRLAPAALDCFPPRENWRFPDPFPTDDIFCKFFL